MIVGGIHPDSRHSKRGGYEYVFTTKRITDTGTFIEHIRKPSLEEAEEARERLLAQPGTQERP